MMPTGGFPESTSSFVSPPITSTSSSWIILTICCPGVTDVRTSFPIAFSFTAFTKSRVTLKLTSASRKARRTSRSESATFSSVRVPCPRRFFSVDSRDSVNCENIIMRKYRNQAGSRIGNALHLPFHLQPHDHFVVKVLEAVLYRYHGFPA